MADKDEVEPTEGSSAALPADAHDDATAAADAAVDDQAFVDEPVDIEPVDALVGPAPEDGFEREDGFEPEDRTEPEDLTEPDEFDAIVRNAGVSDPNEPDGNATDGDEKVLEPAGVGAASVSRSTSAGRATPAPKGTPTSRRDEPAKREPRTTPVKFIRQSVGELRKVVYPTGEQLIKYFVVVLVFVLFIIAFVSVLDLAFGAAVFRIFS